MENLDILHLFQGVETLIQSFSVNPAIFFGRVGMMILGMVLLYMGKKGILEPLLMIPMGLGMCAVNAGVLFLGPQTGSAIRQGAPPLARGPRPGPGTSCFSPPIPMSSCPGGADIWCSWRGHPPRRSSRECSCVSRECSCVLRECSCVLRECSCVSRECSCVSRESSCVLRECPRIL